MEIKMLAKIGIVIQTVLAASIFYLGFTIYSFTTTVSNVVDSYPNMLNEIDKTSQKLEIEQWLELANKFELLVPQILVTVEDMRGTIDKVNQTVVSVDQKLPLVLEEVQIIRSETVPEVIQVMNAVNQQTVPNTLAELKQYRIDVIPVVTTESKNYRTTTIPDMLKESAKLRNELPILITKMDTIVDKSKELSQQAAEGAVKGVLLSPIQLIKDAGNEIRSKVEE